MIKKTVNKFTSSLRFQLSASNNPLFIGFYKYFYKPKEGSLSAFLDAYSKSKVNELTVIQVGANDGITHDPIHKFIKRDKWKGVLLEPQSHVFENYLKKIYQKNKGLHTLCAALGSSDGKETLYKVGFSNMRWATGLASFQRDVLEKAFTTGMVQSQCEKYNIQIPEASKQIVSEEVMIISPETLLEKYQINNIDLLQIDTEGFDFEIIRIFQIDKFRPRAIIYENTHLSQSDKQLCLEHLAKHNYKVKNFGANTLALLEPVGDFKRFFEA
ncbi:MAG: FkbM family methyltransferase [Croceimicrobium sp.]|nr:FkbM family methyltransferase [Bacteroidota bacterium]